MAAHRPTTFHSYPKLPPELRFLIWDLCQPEPQIIHLRLRTRDLRTVPPKEPYQLCRCDRKDLTHRSIYSPTPFSPLLHACKESRVYAFEQWYTLSHPNMTGGPTPEDSHLYGETFFFNPEHDFIHLHDGICTHTSNNSAISFLNTDVVQRITRIIMYDTEYPPEIFRVLSKFTNLKELVILCAYLPFQKYLSPTVTINEITKSCRCGWLHLTAMSTFQAMLNRENAAIQQLYMTQLSKYEHAVADADSGRDSLVENRSSPRKPDPPKLYCLPPRLWFGHYTPDREQRLRIQKRQCSCCDCHVRWFREGVFLVRDMFGALLIVVSMIVLPVLLILALFSESTMVEDSKVQ